MEKIRIEQHSSIGLLWIGGWLFTLGYLAHLLEGVLAIFIWPYYLGVTRSRVRLTIAAAGVSLYRASRNRTRRGLVARRHDRRASPG
jgi:hypothetical protein